jgi:hypothetical protein
MGILINTSDFVGKYAISQNNFSKLNEYITDYETKYLYDLLGKTLADLFIASVVNNQPVGASYLAIYNVIELEIGLKVERNEGMKNMLLGFIYFEYMRKSPIKNTITGNTINANENSTPTFDCWGLTTRYNSSVNDYKIIQYYINQNLTDYPNYLGMQKGFALPF